MIASNAQRHIHEDCHCHEPTNTGQLPLAPVRSGSRVVSKRVWKDKRMGWCFRYKGWTGTGMGSRARARWALRIVMGKE